jgi:hypothetical protein
MDDMGNNLGNLRLEDDSASDRGSRHSSMSRENVGGQSRQPASASTVTNAPSIYRLIACSLLMSHQLLSYHGVC